MPKIRQKSPTHENADANITCDFVDGDNSRSRSRLPASHIVSSIISILHTHLATLLRLRNRALVAHIYLYIGCSKRRATWSPEILVPATCVGIYRISGHCSWSHIFTLPIYMFSRGTAMLPCSLALLRYAHTASFLTRTRDTYTLLRNALEQCCFAALSTRWHITHLCAPLAVSLQQNLRPKHWPRGRSGPILSFPQIHRGMLHDWMSENRLHAADAIKTYLVVMHRQKQRAKHLSRANMYHHQSTNDTHREQECIAINLRRDVATCDSYLNIRHSIYLVS